MFLFGCTAPPPLVRVTFFGDSITVGYNDVVFDPLLLDGFRPETAAGLLAKGAQVQWAYVGNNIGGPTPLTSRYQAGSGATIQNQTANIGNYFGQGIIGPGQGVARVDVARFLLGTNNVLVDPASTITNYTALLNSWFSKFPSSAASCAMIPPCRTDIGVASTVATMNANIATVVASQVGMGRAVVQESAAGLVDADYAAGGVHLIASGNTKMAVVAANGIYAAAQLAVFIP